MFIKKEEKILIKEQLTELEEYREKQQEERIQFQEQLSKLVEYSEKQAETIESLRSQNTLLQDNQEKQAKAFNSQIAVLEESRNQQTTMLQILSDQNAELHRTNTSMIEQRDKSEAVLIEAVGKIADLKEYSTAIYTEEQKKKAAYALNLCMVSISQIVDYDDLYILDQEYDMVLNNLNLENMPKDEALLSILKQTLDTITYFKIQEGDKRFIDKEYQHNIKNAVFDSVPRNLNILTCGESPWAIAISAALSLTCQIGTGYMNYRRNKARYNINRDKQKWQLQRSAMEQFNGLRRDLFDTAWRLADEYNFADELRLTERQIDLYNEILDDTDDLRKYERLDIIKDAFEAYPPFWYFIGDTAARIATNQTSNAEMIKSFKELAVSHFEKFIKMSRLNLLRENTLLSTCALEYIELLDSNKDSKKIFELLELAQENAGNENDIIELIGIAFMKMNKYDQASNSFRRLINEGYNVGINVQLLSSLYVQEYLDNPSEERKKEIEELYTTLQSRTRGNDTFRLPVNSDEDWNLINKEFVETQQERIIDLFTNMVEELEKKYNILYNRLIPLDLTRNREFTDSWYIDDDTSSENSVTMRRYNEIVKNITKEDRFSIYCILYSEETYSEKTLSLFGELLNCVSRYLSNFISFDPQTEYEIVTTDSNYELDLYDYLYKSIRSKSSAFKYIDLSFENRDPKDQFMTAIKDVNFYKLTGDYFSELVRRGEINIRRTTSMNELFEFESCIRALCIDQNIRVNSRLKVMPEEDSDIIEIPLNVIYGDEAKDKIEDKLSILNKKTEISLVIKDYEKDIILNPIETRIYTEKNDINKYINDSRLSKKLGRTNILAIINDKGKRNKDLILTLEGVYIITGDHFLASGEILNYKDITYNKTNTITFSRKGTIMHKYYYMNPAINTEKLYSLLVEISSLVNKNK